MNSVKYVGQVCGPSMWAKYVGMDVYKDITVIVVLTEAGHVESRTQVKTKAENFRDFFRGLSSKVKVSRAEQGDCPRSVRHAVQQAAAPKTRRVGVPCWAEMLFWWTDRILRVDNTGKRAYRCS